MLVVSKSPFVQLQFPDGSPEPEPWFPYYQRGRDNPYTELNSQSQTSFALSSLTSGYFSTSGSVYNSTSSDNQPDSCHSVACSRDSVTSQDIGSTLNDHHFISSTVHQSTTPTALLQQHHQGKRTNPFSELIMYSCIDGHLHDLHLHDLHFWRVTHLLAFKLPTTTTTTTTAKK